MKILVLILPLLFAFNLVNNEYEDGLKCADFKKGKFELVNLKDNRKFIIERHDEFQSEETYNLESGEMIGIKKFYKIKWISDCEFNLLADTIKNEYDEKDVFINSKGGINIEIVSIENNCATIRSSFEDFVSEAKLCKIK